MVLLVQLVQTAPQAQRVLPARQVPLVLLVLPDMLDLQDPQVLVPPANMATTGVGGRVTLTKI